MLIFLAGVGLFLPGLCWWAWLDSKGKDPLEDLANIVGVSISATAIFALLFFQMKVSINFLALLISSVIWIGLSIWGLIKKRGIKLSWTWMAALVAFGGVVVWRLFQARNLVLPAWVDSLHHVLIVRKIIEIGGLPGELSPFIQGPFYYHFAFHALSAKFTVLSQISVAQAVLILGQVLNAAIGLSVYALGKIIFKDWRPAALAAILVSFLSLMPGYYLAWGRYTLTTGLILLPLAMARAITLLSGERNIRDLISMAVLTAGTLLAHYFTAILLAIFLVVLSIGYLVNNRRNLKSASKPLINLELFVLAGFVVVLPWLWRVFQWSRMGVGVSVNLPEEFGGFISNRDQWQYLWYLLGEKGGHVLVLLSLPALVLAFIKPQRRIMAFWAAIMALLALPWGLRIQSVRSDHFAIVLFLPLALLGAGLFMDIIDLSGRVSKRIWMRRGLFVLIMLGAVVWGLWENRDVVNGKTILANEADVKAIAWISSNTPEEARFFINTTTWGYDISRGVDGGAWILPLADRWTIAPTLFYTFGQDQRRIKQIRDWGLGAQEISGCSDAFWQLVNDAELTHIYLKEGKGSLSAKVLSGCSGVDKVYDVVGVSIWEMKSSTP